MQTKWWTRFNGFSVAAALLLGLMWAGGVRGQSTPETPPPESSFLPAVEVACTAADNPQAFSKRVVPATPNSQTNVKLILTTDNIPILTYALVRTSPSSVDVFLQVIRTISPFPYEPLFKCYELPIGSFVVGTVSVNFERAGRTGAFLGNYVRNPPGFDTFSFGVMPYVPQNVPSLGVFGVVALALLLLALAWRVLSTGRVLMLFLAITPPLMICHSESAFAQTRADPNVTSAANEKKYERQLFVALDVKRKDIDQKRFLREAKEKNGIANGLNVKLGSPEDAERLLYREPTPFEARLYEAGQSDELHVLHRTVVLTYTSKAERDKQKEKVVRVDGVKSVYEPSDVALSTVYPNEELFFLGGAGGQSSVIEQWGLHLLKYPEAWQLTAGSAWISAIDGGIATTHVDLKKNLRKHLSRNFAQPNWFDTVDVTPGATAAAENFVAHGTHVAGTLAAENGNGTLIDPISGVSGGAAGGCPNCSLTMMKWEREGGEQQAINGIVRAVDSGMQVLNLSFETDRQFHNYCGSPLAGYSLQDDGGVLCVALSHAARNGLAMAAAAGNHGNTKESAFDKAPPLRNLPAVHPDVLAVSGLTITNNSASSAGSGTGINRNDTGTGLRFWHGRVNPSNANDWWGSNYGLVTNGLPQISFAAPAQQITSTAYPSYEYIPSTLYGADSACGDFANGDPANLIGSSNSDGVGQCTGNSMAAPHIAAMAGLVKSANPLLDTAGVKSVLIQAAECLETGTNKPCTESSTLGGIAGDAMKKLGYGVPKADKAVQIALGGPTAKNRLTPLFGYYNTNGDNHFYTTNPQMAIAAKRNTLLPAPKYKLSPSHVNCTVSPEKCSGSPFVDQIFTTTLPDGVVQSSTTVEAVFQSEFSNAPLARASQITSNSQNTNFLPVNPNVPGRTVTSLPAPVGLNEIIRPVVITTFPLKYEEIGLQIPGYPNLPCGSKYTLSTAATATNSACEFYPARAVAMLLTTHVDPTNTGRTLKPVYRFSCDPHNTTCNIAGGPKAPFHVAFRYITKESDVPIMTNTFQYDKDGIEGYVFEYVENGTRPPGTQALCIRRNEQRHDHMMYLVNANFCSASDQTNDSFVDEMAVRYGLTGIDGNGYTQPTVTLGYAYPVQQPKALPDQPSPPTQSFNGDTFADLFWLSTSPLDTSVWFQQGEMILPQSAAASPTMVGNSDWRVVATGDIDGDGKADIVWVGIGANIGHTRVWKMSGASHTDFTFPASTAPGYEAVAIGDLNGDGRADIILKSTNPATAGQYLVWYMSATSAIAGWSSFHFPAGMVSPNPVADWKIVGVADLNGDGKADFFFRNQVTGGNIAAFTSVTTIPNGVTPISYQWLPAMGAVFRVAGVADVSGDGQADVVWMEVANPPANTAKCAAVWLLVSGQYVAGNYLA